MTEKEERRMKRCALLLSLLLCLGLTGCAPTEV